MGGCNKCFHKIRDSDGPPLEAGLEVHALAHVTALLAQLIEDPVLLLFNRLDARGQQAAQIQTVALALAVRGAFIPQLRKSQSAINIQLK